MDRVHLGGEELQAATQVALLAEQGLLVAQHLAVLRLQRLQRMDDFDFKMLYNEFVTQVKGAAHAAQFDLWTVQFLVHSP